MTLSSRAIEAGARAMAEARVRHNMMFDDEKRSEKFIARAISCAWRDYIPLSQACITAALAAEGMVLVPKEPTAKMIAAAFPTTDRDVPSRDDLKIGAEAIMILEGGRDCGSITGPAVREAASMCKDYRAMLSAHQADEDSEGK